jgi:uncharacterized membrane protein YGL010W
MSKTIIIRNLIILPISIFVIIESRNYTDHANLLPTFCAIGIIIFSILDFFQNKDTYLIPNKFKLNSNNLRPYLIVLFSVIYVYLILFLGFFTSTALYFIFTSFFLGVRNYKSLFLTLIILIPLMYGFFVIFLKTNLPKGIVI